jgi:hypothetical protein
MFLLALYIPTNMACAAAAAAVAAAFALLWLHCDGHISCMCGGDAGGSLSCCHLC